MKLFKRIKCVFGHHEPWTEPTLEPPSPLAGTLASLTSSGAITLSIQPFKTDYRVCRHCHKIYWKTEIDTGYLMRATKIPGYNEWLNWRNMQERERALQEENPTLKELWENYEMAKKLYQEQNGRTIKLNP